MQRENNFTKNNREIKRATIKSVLLMIIFVVVMAIIFFIAAGRLDISRAWLFFGVMILYYMASIIVLRKFNPELIVERLKRKKDAKLWDKILMRAMNLTGIIGFTAVAGLDVGRFRWSYFGNQFAVLGYVLLICSAIFFTWAMAVNRHFEPTVRIQKDRDHKVVSTGPYKIVRHPGYSGGILYYIAMPLIIGSVYGLIPGAIAIILLIIRTALEDKTLQNELNGYFEYAKKVKYRIVPGIW